MGFRKNHSSVTVVGRVTFDPQYKVFDNGKSVMNVTVRVINGAIMDGDKPAKDDNGFTIFDTTDFVFSLWDADADRANNDGLVSKGMDITVIGKPVATWYTNKNGDTVAQITIKSPQVFVGNVVIESSEEESEEEVEETPRNNRGGGNRNSGNRNNSGGNQQRGRGGNQNSRSSGQRNRPTR